MMTKPTSEQVTFLAAGSGAVQRTALDKFRETVSVKDFGVVGDNVTDDAPALTAAVAACASTGRALWCPAGMTVYIASAVDMRGVSVIHFESSIRANPAIATIPVTVGGFSTGTVCSLRFRDVYDNANIFAVGSRPVFRIFGLKRSVVEIGGCNWIQIWADAATPGGDSNIYNDIYLNGGQGRFTITDSGSTLTPSANNENLIWQGGIKELEVVGVGYSHNHNKFYNNVFEGAVSINFSNAVDNYVYGARFEQLSGAGISFGSDTLNNAVFKSWSGAGYVGAKFLAPSYSDSGEGNVVSTEACVSHKPTCLVTVSPQSLIVSNSSSSACADYRVGRNAPHFNPTTSVTLVPGLSDVVAVESGRMICLTDYISVEVGDTFGFSGNFSGASVRPVVYVFDDKMRPITSEGSGGKLVDIPAVAALTSNSGYGYYVQAANTTRNSLNRLITASIRRPEVGYVRIGILNGVSNLRFRELSVFCWTRPSQFFSSSYASQRLVGQSVLNGAPTRGYLPTGFQVLDSSASPTTTLQYVSFSHETSLSAGAASSATSVTVTSPSTIANGDIVGLLLDDDTTHWTTVSSLAGSTFTVSALPSAAASGNRIVFNRWTT